MNSVYKYEVAFSFLAQDESLAVQLNDLLQDRLKTFLYTERQKEIAGTDGEKTFHKVFGEEARLVVVLYRKGWGETPWTRIEETAIRNRGYENGYDFTVFVPLDDPPAVPKWLSKNRLYVGLKRWGVPGAASVIEDRLQELGVEPHEETPLDRAARLERAQIHEQERTQFLNSSDGVEAADAEFRSLASELDCQIEIIKAKHSRVWLNLIKEPNFFLVSGLKHSISLRWERFYKSSLDDSKMTVILWDGSPAVRGVDPNSTKRLETIEFSFDLLMSGQRAWVERSKKQAYSAADLASFVLNHYLKNQS